MRKVKRGFTLIEIMLAVALFGIIATVALAPLVFTVRSLKTAQSEWLANGKQEMALEQIFDEIRECVRQGTDNPIRIERASGLSVADDSRLVVYSYLPLKRGRNVAVCVYRVFKEDKLRKVAGGLYRFEFALPLDAALLRADATDKSPLNIDTEKLEPKQGRNIIPSAKGIRFYALRDGQWVEDYIGTLPAAVKFELKREKGVSEYAESFRTEK